MPTELLVEEPSDSEGSKRSSLQEKDQVSEDSSSDDGESQVTTVVEAPTGPFDPTAYIDLTGKDICRAVYPVSFKSQKKRIKLVCGRTDCKFHRNATTREKGRFFVRQSKGGVEHGRADLPSFSKAEFKEKHDKFIARLDAEIAAKAHEEVIFEKIETPKKNKLFSDQKSPPLSSAAKKPHFDLGATTFFTRKPKVKQGVHDGSPLIYGLEDVLGERNLTWDAELAILASESNDVRLGGVWIDARKANEWLQDAPGLSNKVEPDSDKEKEEGSEPTRDSSNRHAEADRASKSPKKSAGSIKKKKSTSKLLLTSASIHSINQLPQPIVRVTCAWRLLSRDL